MNIHASFVLQTAFIKQHTVEMNWRLRPIREPRVLKGHDDHVITCLQFSESRIVSGSDDNTLKVWSVTSGKVSNLIFIFYLFAHRIVVNVFY